ncbi:hypothetical protein SDC9_120483 [bioreactor metagenome]|uniref:Uncharacterized protein n=1 Tax=bioreactor metagenome TaxID=1076179 RepID=A0A645C9B1_9ZZZZ|nr:hypothetical protein [Candidatus Metalachnospira sp.]
MLRMGNKCYVIEYGTHITLVEILSIQGVFYTIRFLNRPHLSVSRLRKSRLYSTWEDAQKVLDEKQRLINIKRIIGEQLELEGMEKLRKRSYWPCQTNYEKRQKK